MVTPANWNPSRRNLEVLRAKEVCLACNPKVYGAGEAVKTSRKEAKCGGCSWTGRVTDMPSSPGGSSVCRQCVLGLRPHIVLVAVAKKSVVPPKLTMSWEDCIAEWNWMIMDSPQSSINLLVGTWDRLPFCCWIKFHFSAIPVHLQHTKTQQMKLPVN